MTAPASNNTEKPPETVSAIELDNSADALDAEVSTPSDPPESDSEHSDNLEASVSPSSSDGNGGDALPPSRKRRIMRRLWKIAKWSLISLTLILMLLLFLLVFFPANFTANQLEKHLAIMRDNGITVGYASFSILSGAELEDIRIEAPKGFTKPLFTAKRVRLEYSPFALTDNEVVIDQVLIDSPHANMEIIDGKSNLDAFLAALSSGAPTEEMPPEPEPEPEAPSEPSTLKIVLKSFQLDNLTAALQSPERSIDFAQLDINLSGYYQQDDSHFDGVITIETPDETKGNIRIVQTVPQPLEAELRLTTRIELKADQVTNPKAGVNFDLLLETLRVKTDKDIKPVKLAIKTELSADMPADTARVTSLGIDFNDQRLVTFSGKLDGLLEQRDIELLLTTLHLPLDAFLPYVEIFVPGIHFGGTVAVDDLSVKGNVPKLLNSGLPEAEGKIRIDDVWAKLDDQQITVRDISTAITVQTRSEAGPDLTPPALRADGRIRVGRVVHPMATVSDLRLDLDAKADGLALSDALATIALRIKDVTLTDPSLGPLSVPVAVDLTAGGDIAGQHFVVKTLKVDVADLIKLDLDAEAQLDPQSGAVTAHRAHVVLHPLDLPRTLALVPPPFRQNLPPMTVSGAIGLDVKTSGAVPLPVGDPMALPVKVATAIHLKNISAKLPDAGLDVAGTSGTITIGGRPADLTVAGQIDIARLFHKEQSLTIVGLALPLDIHFTPTKVDASIGVKLAQLKNEAQAATLDGVELAVSTTASGRLLAQDIRGVTAKASVNVEDILYAKTMTVRVGGQRTEVTIDYTPKSRSAAIGLLFGFDSLSVAEQQTEVDDYVLKMNSTAHGIDLPLAPNADLHPELAELAVDMSIGAVRKPDVLTAPMLDSTLTIRGKMHDMRDVELEPFVFTAPSLGVVLDMTGNVWGLMDRNMQPPDFKTRFPEFDVQVFAGLDSTERSRLMEGLETRGKAGLNVRVRSLPDNFARIDGKIVANDFWLWQTQTGEIEREDGSREPTRTEIVLAGFDADVPMVQLVNLQNQSVVEAKGDILQTDSRGVLYDTMRRYSRQQSNFQIDSITWSRTEGDVSKTLAIDEIALDMIYRDNTFAIDRMYIALLGGGITGALQMQLAALPPDPIDVRVHFENQITGVNLGYLTAKPGDEVTPETELSSLINLDFGLQSRHVEGRVDITRLSLKHLDRLLQFLDPAGKDPNVQKNRDLINAWYITMLNPRVDLVSMWIKYGNLNIDIGMEAGIATPIITRTLANSRIRRLNIVPIMNAFLPGGEDDETNRIGQQPGSEPTTEVATSDGP